MIQPEDPLKAAVDAFPAPNLPHPICAHVFLAMRFPARGLLLAPWLPQKGLAMLAAPRGLGKTHVALNVAFAVATGGSFLRWRADAARRVLYVDGEMPAVSLQERLARIVDHSPAKLAPDALAFLAADQCEFGLPDLSTPEGQALLRPRLEPFDLIVLDNLSTLCRSGRENEAESWGHVQAFALELRRANKSVLFVHHTGKGGAQRGTSKREDVLDSVLLLKRPEDYQPGQGARFIVEFDKARGFTGDAAEAFEAALDPGTGLWSMKPATESRDAQIRELKEQGLSNRDIAKETGISKSTVNRVLQRQNGAVNGQAC